MKNLLIIAFFLLSYSSIIAQIDKEQLALDVSKAESENTEKLKEFIWKRYTTTSVEGEIKSKVTTELSFNESGELQATSLGAESSVKQKRGIRGKMQKNAMEDNAEYVGKALQIAIAYTYMSKGQLLDFFEKATVTEQADVIKIIGTNILLQGDKLTVLLDKETKLYINKKFSSNLDKDIINGEIIYEKFSSGINHVSETILNLPAKKAIINAKNMDYSQRIN